jgi:hypothetical protein
VVSVSDPDEEVQTALRLVTEWMREGIRLGRVGLFYATADPYARLFHEQLAAAGLPHNGAPVRDIGDMLSAAPWRGCWLCRTASSAGQMCWRW